MSPPAGVLCPGLVPTPRGTGICGNPALQNQALTSAVFLAGGTRKHLPPALLRTWGQRALGSPWGSRGSDCWAYRAFSTVGLNLGKTLTQCLWSFLCHGTLRFFSLKSPAPPSEAGPCGCLRQSSVSMKAQ
jgi:hypothetical protein